MAIPLIFLTAAALPEERVRGLIEGAVDYITKPFNFDEIRLRVCIHLNATHGHDHAPGAPDEAGPSGSVEAAVFVAAQRRILQDLAATPELASLARSVGTNTRLLNEAFRKYVGVTVFDYLREARMKEALGLLSETDLEVQTIANDLGYASAANFSTAFRERFGLSPRQYRKATPRAVEDT
jgi:transcriptional regulator GlxA family with amidase domain